MTKEKTYSFNEILLKKGKKVCSLKDNKITDSCKTAELIRSFYNDDLEIYESVFILCLNNRNMPTGFAKISQGGLASVVVDIRIISKIAIDSLSTGIILAHNHPSGCIEPSSEDRKLTQKVKEAMKIFDIRFLDHLIITADNYYSFSDNGSL